MFANLDFHTACYLLGYSLFIGIRGIHDRAEARISTRHGCARKETLLMVATGTGIMLLPLLFVASDLLDEFNYAPMRILQALGIGAMLIGLALFWRAHRDLGRNFSRTLEVHSDHQLVTGGIYRFCRHPIYAAIWLIVLAQVLILPNWVAGPSGLIGFGALYFLRVAREEAMMRQVFGLAYDVYAERTGRLFPRVSLHRESGDGP